MQNNHFQKKACPFLLLLLLLLSGCSASAPGKKYTEKLFAMDTIMDLTVYNDPEAIPALTDRIRELEGLFSATDPDSELWKLNHGSLVHVSEDTFLLLTQALAICRQTKGALDLSIRPLMPAWGFTGDSFRVPSDAELSNLLSSVDYTAIRLDPSDRSVSFPEGMELDLGGVAKGYTGRCLAELLKERGVTSALLNLGGNVQAVGAKPDGSSWRIAIRDPLGEGSVGTLEIQDEAVVTSGGYERYFEQDGTVYWHILDPATGRPAHSGLLSVTVVSQDGLLCDALSTALFVMGKERALELWKSNPEFDLILVDEDGAVTLTEGIDGRFTPSGKSRPEIVHLPHSDSF